VEKVHIMKWSGNQRIYAVYLDHKKACDAAEYVNKRRSWIYRLMGEKWVVKTFDVKD